MYRSYLNELGFEWSLIRQKANQLTFTPQFSRNGRTLLQNQLSSGESEIINIINGIVGGNIRNGFVLIDEPEVHLHPKWQKVLLKIFKRLSKDRNLQFIFTTHSPSFVAPENIQSVFRIFIHNETSSIASVKNIDDIEKHLIQMIDTHKNERLFFAEKIVLVEGIGDRIIIEKILNDLVTEKKIFKTFEVIEVHGKNNFKNYQSYLSQLRLPYAVVADLDYAETMGEKDIKSLFLENLDKADSKLNRDKKGNDKGNLLELILQENWEKVKTLAEHIIFRFKKLKEHLLKAESDSLSQFITNQANQNIFILSQGELEKYLPDGYRSIDKIIELVNLPNWKSSFKKDKIDELDNIVNRIIL